LIVRGGEWEKNNVRENHPHQDVGVAKIITEGNEPRGLVNNIALLFLTPPGFWTNLTNIHPICLPSADDEGVFNNPPCYVTGFGTESIGM